MSDDTLDALRYSVMMGQHQRGGGKSELMRLALQASLADGIAVALCTREGVYRVRRVQHAPFVLDLYERLETPEWALKN
jgi:hypothetical protein